ncbi:DUF2141 domain-containing protein [Alkalimonas sp.]|uniref:DUF2141 domain-containing protein n=1 Tax=Alkalimonas sp. TaxID=1872453 RepID=UPI00263AC5B3|nr:DUF2141 domain-containing protein [Alkalimonas sp.]MCC5825027.1 DUF2141 domain-containing protein [Alkalimonas sp.]
MTARSLFLGSCLAAGSLLASPLLLADTLYLHVQGIASDQGQVVVQVYDSEQHWLSDKPEHMVLRFKVDAAEVVSNPKLALPLPYGRYAIQVFQDLDSNGKLRTNWLGIPREPVGTSNNATGRMGPPKFDDASFEFSAENPEHKLDMVNI